MKGLLKFMTCGSVDDGKSTLLGHLLYDAKLLFTDQKAALELESRAGSADGSIDYSLVLDGLAAEREQGITIDVAYRYFTTPARSFIAADCPGHEEYTRNMAVGASFADVAVILLDATKGVLTQTRRHTRICALMGIRHFVYAVNKMDLAGYSEATFAQVGSEIEELVAPYAPSSLTIIPTSATEGDNVVHASGNMPWYEGPTLQSCLENIDVSFADDSASFVMPVQRVSRPDSSFRGFQGTIASGSLKVGDTVRILPSLTQSKVARIVEGFDDVSEAGADRAVTVCLEDEVDVSRGCVLVEGGSAQVAQSFSAELLWMDDTPLVAGKSYLFHIGTKEAAGRVSSITCQIDVNTGEHIIATDIEKNALALCEIRLDEPVVVDTFDSCRQLGSMILIDRVTNMTSAAAVVHKIHSNDRNLTWSETTVTRQTREQLMGHRGVTLWLTGLSGSGKSTLANAVEAALNARGRHTMLLDGDNIRMGLNRDLGFGEGDRSENIRRVAEVARLMNDAGLIVITSFISPFTEDRRMAKEAIGADSFIEVHLSTPIEECERRDVKGLYKRARSGEIASFTGISSPYEAPESADVTIDTSSASLSASVAKVLGYLEKML